MRHKRAAETLRLSVNGEIEGEKITQKTWEKHLDTGKLSQPKYRRKKRLPHGIPYKTIALLDTVRARGTHQKV